MNKLSLDLALSISCVCFLFDIYLCATSQDIRLCPPGWHAAIKPRVCLQINYQLRKYEVARQICQTFGGDLLINFDEEKAKVIFADGRRKPFIIGLNHQKNFGVFRWLDNPREITNLPWAASQPDLYNRDKRCVLLINNPVVGSNMHTFRCREALNYICESYPDCPTNTFGFECAYTCNLNCAGQSNACDNFTGFCKHGCDDGYLGDRCDVPCAHSTFGKDCSKKCPENCGGPVNACNNVNGLCTDGCDAGYKGQTCNEPCTKNTFGQSCLESCNSKCGGPADACDRFTGFCSNGCDDGYQGDRCEAPCAITFFGVNCSEICSQNCGGQNNTCDNVDGFCKEGCDEGYFGKRCQTRQTRSSTAIILNLTKVVAALMFLLIFLTIVLVSFRPRNPPPIIAYINEPEVRMHNLDGTEDNTTEVGPTLSVSGVKSSSIFTRSVPSDQLSSLHAGSGSIESHTNFRAPDNHADDVSVERPSIPHDNDVPADSSS